MTCTEARTLARAFEWAEQWPADLRYQLADHFNDCPYCMEWLVTEQHKEAAALGPERIAQALEEGRALAERDYEV